MDINKLKELVLAATPGPWPITELAQEFGFDPTYEIEVGDDAISDRAYYPSAPTRIEDARFIAAFNPCTAKALLDERDALIAENERLRARLAAWVPHQDGDATEEGDFARESRADLIEHILMLRREVDACAAPAAGTVEKDAERYRWLCAKFGVTSLPCALERFFERGYIADGKESIDAAIDAAITASKEST